MYGARARARVCVPMGKQLGAGPSGARASTRSVEFCRFGSAVGLSTASWDGERNAHDATGCVLLARDAGTWLLITDSYYFSGPATTLLFLRYAGS